MRPGDTLWDLAEFYLNDPFLWPEIYRLNTMVVEDPHWIYPAEQLVLPGRGEVRPPPQPPEEEEVAERPPPQPPEVEEVPEELPELQEGRTIFAARELTRTTLTYQPVPPVPGRAVTSGDYYRSGLLAPLQELGPRGEVAEVAQQTGNVMVATTRESGDRLVSVRTFDRIYVSHPDGEAPEPGDRLLLFRVERRVRPYGRVVRPTGLGTVAAIHSDVSTVVVTEVYARIEIGNQAALVEHFELEPGVFAEPVGTGPSGELVALLDPQAAPTVSDIGFISLGRSQGITPGDEFEIYVRQRKSNRGLTLPEEHVARARVVRVTENTSTVRFIEQRHPAIARGLPVRLVAKMPS